MATTSTEVFESVSCAVDRTRPPEAACGCDNPSQASTRSPRRTGAKAAIVAALCAAACLAVPLAAGGVAAVSGALAGEWLIVAGTVLVTAVVGTVMLRRRGSAC